MGVDITIFHTGNLIFPTKIPFILDWKTKIEHRGYLLKEETTFIQIYISFNKQIDG